MKKNMCMMLATVIVVGALSAAGGTQEATAEVYVNINLGPPPIVVAEPPALVMIPGQQVFFVPQLDFDVFFHAGYWWSPRGNDWYRSRAYNGPWGVVERRHVPAPVFQVPHDYRGRYEKEKHIPYGQWKKQGYGHGENNHGEGKKKHKKGRNH
jgi:hypothetical protein